MAKKTQEEHDYLIPELKLTQVSDIRYEKLPIIKNSEDAAKVLSTYIVQKDLLTQISVNEFAFVLYLNKQNRVIGMTNLSIGGLDATLMDVRMVYSMAVKIGASSIITAHNHPSQNLKPSEADIKMSSLISQGGRTLSIQTLDFMILTSSSGYYSFADEGMMAQGGMFAKGGITEHGLRVGDTIVEEIDASTIVVENPASGRRTINISTGNAMAKGGKVPTIKESDIEVGRKFELANGEIIEIKKLFTDTTYRDENRVEYSRDGKLTENGVNALKIFINNFRKDITVPSLFAEGGRMGFKALSQKVAQNYEGKSVPAKYRPEYGSRYDKEEAKEVGNKVAAKVYRMQQGK